MLRLKKLSGLAITGTLAWVLMAAMPFAATDAHAATTKTPQIDGHCASKIQGYGAVGGIGLFYIKKQIARQRAIYQWRQKSETTYGPNYNKWFRATGKEVRCDAAVGKVHCVARANPCTGTSILGAVF